MSNIPRKPEKIIEEALSIDDDPDSDNPTPPADRDGALAAAVADARRAGGER